MGIYLNPGGEKFLMTKNSKIYVDKSGLITYLNKVLRTEQRFVCVSRPRRFGKSMAANMIAAYYDRTADLAGEFRNLAIGTSPGFEVHLGKYDVIQISMQGFLSLTDDVTQMLALLQKSILRDLLKEYPNGDYLDQTNLVLTMLDIYETTRRPFVIIIDEWDAIFREYKGKKDWHEKYLDFLRTWLKDQAFVGLAYMTGILPIKKCGTHSALNMFDEFSMTNPSRLAEYVGFTAAEVKNLCLRFGQDFNECQAWYDGYFFPTVGEVYNPRSVVAAMTLGVFDSYWNKTETFEALKVYIDMNFDGLREAIIALMAGERRHIPINSVSRQGDDLHSVSDVLAMLIYLGYLGYDFAKEEVFIPNQEISQEFATAVEKSKWDVVCEALAASNELLAATLAKDSEAVARGIAAAHLDTSHITYNSEAALAYTISLAFYTARQKYAVKREFPTGKCFADLVFIPRTNHPELPALVLELKWNKAAKTAINQIKERDYPQSVADFSGKMLLVGVSYDKDTKVHECLIEEWRKSAPAPLPLDRRIGEKK